MDLVSSSWSRGAKGNAAGLNTWVPQLLPLKLPGSVSPLPSYQIQALGLKPIHSSRLAAVHVVPQRSMICPEVHQRNSGQALLSVQLQPHPGPGTTHTHIHNLPPPPTSTSASGKT